MKKVILALASVVLLSGTAHAGKAPAAPTGNDISYPQCGGAYPSKSAFGIVGVNGGKATTFNSCFASELAWAQKTTGAVAAQPKAQLYVNTANPGDVLEQYAVTTWPTSSDPSIDPYGTCSGTYTNDRACAWQYGYERAQADVTEVSKTTSPADYVWWLDVETGNSWTNDPAKNRAALEGMVYGFNQAGAAKVGIYSTSAQWSTIGGSVPAGSPLYVLNEWRPGARNLSGAQSNCSLAPFTGGGKVVLTQYVSANLDYDYSCL